MQKLKKKSNPQNRHGAQFRILEYEISYEPFNPPGIKKMPRQIHDQYKVVYNLAQSKPQEAIPMLKQLIKKNPKEPRFNNLLASLYTMTNDLKNAEEIACENYKMNPKYLFAKINYAQLCLGKNDLTIIPQIFNNKFDLTALYPNRNKFHVSEYIGFAGVVGEYFARIGNKDVAMLYLNSLQKIAPKHMMTKNLKRLLKPSLKQKFIKKIDEKIQQLEESQPKLHWKIEQLKQRIWR